jgi:probable F420-dependent oxidoreductase
VKGGFVRIGFSLPLHGSAAGPEGLITIAKRAELLGYESLWVWDRLLAPVNPKAPYPLGDGTHPPQFRSVLDPLEALAFIAGHTERISLGTSVLILSLYNPTLLARQLTTLDIVSNGRLKVGLGVRWNSDEAEAAGVSWSERGKRADEALLLLKAIWTMDPVEFKGTYYQIPLSYIGPKPIQKPHPPIYLGAFTPAAMRRIAEHADGWNVVGVPLRSVPVMFEAIKEKCREIGREPGELELVVRANVNLSAKSLGADRIDFHGTLDQVAEDVRTARQIGATELFFDLWTAHPVIDTVDDWLIRMEQLWQIAT